MVRPWAICVAEATGTDPPDAPVMWGDMLSAMAPMYQFMRGGVRFKWMYASAATNTVMARCFLDWNMPTVPEIGGVTSPTFYTRSHYAVQNANFCNNEVGVPFYNRLPYVPIRWSTYTEDEPLDIYTNSLTLNVLKDAGFANPTGFQLGRSIPDDFQLGYFLGPPLWTKTEPTVVAPDRIIEGENLPRNAPNPDLVLARPKSSPLEPKRDRQISSGDVPRVGNADGHVAKRTVSGFNFP